MSEAANLFIEHKRKDHCLTRSTFVTQDADWLDKKDCWLQRTEFDGTVTSHFLFHSFLFGFQNGEGKMIIARVVCRLSS